MNKEFNRMRELAGLLTEGLYTSDAKAPMEAMHTEEGSRMTKSEMKRKIREMMNQEGYMGTPYDSSGDMALDMIKTGAGLPESTIGQEAYAEMGSMDEASYEASERMDGLAPVAARRSLVRAASAIIGALKSDGFEEEEIYDYLLDLITTLPMDEGLFEAKKDEGSDTEDVIVADTEEVPAEDAGMKISTDDTKVDVNMDGVPDVDTGSAESKKAFTSLVDTYNASKQLGDAKLTQMIANALTYYNKNIILKTSQPQA